METTTNPEAEMNYGAMTVTQLSADDSYAAHATEVLNYRVMVAPDGSRWAVQKWEATPLRRAGWKRAA